MTDGMAVSIGSQMEAGLNLDLVSGDAQSRVSRRLFTRVLKRSVPWNVAAFLALWEAQSQLATIAYVGLIAFTSIWVTLAAMLVWSLTATVVFFVARERGYPNILSGAACQNSHIGLRTAWYAVSSVVRAALAGVHAFVFTRFSNAILSEEPVSGKRAYLRRAVIAVGMTLFGVTVVEHLLRSAGYSGRRLLRMGLVGPFLNVPYRVLVSAAVVALLHHSLGLFPNL